MHSDGESINTWIKTTMGQFVGNGTGETQEGDPSGGNQRGSLCTSRRNNITFKIMMPLLCESLKGHEWQIFNRLFPYIYIIIYGAQICSVVYYDPTALIHFSGLHNEAGHW